MKKLLLLAMFIGLTGSSMFARTHISIGFGFGVPAYYGGYYAPAPVVMYAPPPAPVAAYPVPYARPGYTWISGYWYPYGGRYMWRAGYWARPPYVGARWYAPRYYGGRYYQGYWGRVSYGRGWHR